MKIPIFRLNYNDDFINRFNDGCQRIFDSGILTNGKHVLEFEKQFATLCGTSHALAVSSGTSALEVVLRALNVKGKTVIIPTNTFIATAVAVENAGAEILPLDIENDSFALSPEEVSKHLRAEIGAVVIVHIGGIISRHIQEIAQMCIEHGVPLVEDACHAHGSAYQNTKAGAFGVAGCFSFFPTKVMTTGEGGMVTTKNKSLFDRMFSIRQFGMAPENKDLHIRPGGNFKMTEFQALLGILDLERLSSRIKRRNDLSSIYRNRLKGTVWKAVSPPDGGKSSCYKQIVLSPLDREEILKHFSKMKIALTGEVYRYPVHHQPVYARFNQTYRYPVANMFCQGHICPPLYPELLDEEVEYICDSLIDLMNNAKHI